MLPEAGTGIISGDAESSCRTMIEIADTTMDGKVCAPTPPCGATNTMTQTVKYILY